MIGTALDDLARIVTTHNRAVILLLLVLTAGMAVGATQLDTGSQAGSADAFPETTES